ncbi:o-succinylbenzoate--CoA ligase [Corynebacterium glutamicum]|uniref:o-succinylbenzoate--CoA ligase n=1 Tax=Corynebacterium glutamicum TaxID=1718 RepID=UPI00094335E6|nr:o-succinylbenzoate--CoA ligase [Corynebacterium glutamicum]OKX86155.1 O-succinylbenzoic acid--CoA ligase [Corynebacterium glutamicum]QDX74700.1 O-succinylbenzoic acid--CoA ligase [Corynebacterium glutamicum]QDX77462.1 O-succinylbenzoic acid--CoA ligase [Corynebacterium glutamicum]QYR17959.1 o-succinylbenzoate--CoA ligase [Corynebacterium glutamicum]TWS33944.1 O-succinylbenzoic acid--CoA ligase [Corynebacterium glutamicum]
MNTRVLEALPVDLADPTAILGDLEDAISGKKTFLPIPVQDKTRAQLLRDSQRVGLAIDPSIALVMATSGSTGTPKGAQLTPLNLVSSADATHQFLGGEGQWLLAMPAHHIAGMQVLIRSLIAGVEPLAIDLSIGFHIDAFADAAAELKNTGDRVYTSLTPMQLLKAMDSLQGIEALKLFDVILVGGAALSKQARISAEQLDINIVTTYGSSETSGGCVYDGKPIPCAKVRISDERIELGGPMIAQGYRNAPEHPDFANEGWFTTSDSGELHDGILTVTGRVDTVIDSGGLKLHPEVLERAIADIKGVTAACVVGIPDPRLGQAIVAAYSGSISPSEVIEGLDDLPRWQLPKRLKHLESLPSIGPGKADRRAIAKLF